MTRRIALLLLTGMLVLVTLGSGCDIVGKKTIDPDADLTDLDATGSAGGLTYRYSTSWEEVDASASFADEGFPATALAYFLPVDEDTEGAIYYIAIDVTDADAETPDELMETYLDHESFFVDEEVIGPDERIGAEYAVSGQDGSENMYIELLAFLEDGYFYEIVGCMPLGTEEDFAVLWNECLKSAMLNGKPLMNQEASPASAPAG